MNKTSVYLIKYQYITIIFANILPLILLLVNAPYLLLQRTPLLVVGIIDFKAIFAWWLRGTVKATDVAAFEDGRGLVC